MAPVCGIPRTCVIQGCLKQFPHWSLIVYFTTILIWSFATSENQKQSGYDQMTQVWFTTSGTRLTVSLTSVSIIMIELTSISAIRRNSSV